MPKKGTKRVGPPVTNVERQCIFLTLMSAQSALPLNSISTPDQHRIIKENLRPAFESLKAGGHFPDGVNTDNVWREVDLYEGKNAADKCGRLKGQIRDQNGAWEVVNRHWDKASQTWKSGIQFEEVVQKILQHHWEVKEKTRVESAEGKRDGQLSPGAKGSQPAKAFEAGKWQGPPWFLCFMFFWSPHGTKPALWCMNPKTEEGKGGALEAGQKAGSRTADRAKTKQDHSILQAEMLQKYNAGRVGVSDGDAEMLGALKDTRRAINLSTLEAKLASLRGELQKAEESSGDLEWKMDEAESRLPTITKAARQRLEARLATADASKAEIKIRIAGCDAEIENFHQPPVVDTNPFTLNPRH
jgi:hypothetical protein